MTSRTAPRHQGLLTQLDHALALPGRPSTAAQALGTTAQYRQARRLFDAGRLAQLVDLLPDLLEGGPAGSIPEDVGRPSRRRRANAEVVLKQMLSMAVRHGVIAANPVREVGRLPRGRKPVSALTLDELGFIRAAIDSWRRQHTTGPQRNNSLADIVELLVATGARIGEVLALRWQDIDLDEDCPTATICGTIVFIKGRPAT